jgi:hypothetical protein
MSTQEDWAVQAKVLSLSRGKMLVIPHPGVAMRHWLLGWSLLLLLFCGVAGSKAASQKKEKLTLDKIDTALLIGSLLQSSLADFEKDPETRLQATQLGSWLGNLREAAQAASYTYLDGKVTVTFDGSRFGAVRLEDRKAVEAALRGWLRFALETRESIQKGDVTYIRMADADIKTVVESLIVRWPVRGEGAGEADRFPRRERLDRRLPRPEEGGFGERMPAGTWQLSYYYTQSPCGGYRAWPVWNQVETNPASRVAPTFSSMRQGVAPTSSPRVPPSASRYLGEDTQLVSVALPDSRSKPASSDSRGLKGSDGEAFFWQGFSLYWQGDRTEALRRFEAATRLKEDARFWYYRSLAERALGDTEAADTSLRRGVELQTRGRPGIQTIGEALERVQGPERMRIRQAVDLARSSGK